MASPEEELQKFRSLIGGTNQSTVNAPPPVAAESAPDPNAALAKFRELTSLPASQNAVNQVRGVEAVPALTTTQREGRRNPATGELIPIENEGIGAAYWRVAMQRGPEAQMSVLSKMYPESNPRQLEDGSIGVTLTDSATGKPKEVIVNPVGMEAHDLIDLAAQMPEIGAGVATALAMGGTGFIKTAAQMVASSLAASGAGAIRDVAARGAEGIDVRLGEIAASRSGEAAFDLFLQTSMLGGSKALRGISPFATDVKQNTLVFDLQKAHQFFKREFGTDVELLPSEITGSPMLQAVEAVEGTQPGARTVMQKKRQAKSAQVRQIIDRALGNVDSEEAIGERSIDILRRGVLPVEQSLEAARAAATQKSHARLTKVLDDLTMPASGRVTSTQAGEETLTQFEQRLQTAKTRVDEAYAKVNEANGGASPFLDGTPAARAAQEIRRELPHAFRGEGENIEVINLPSGMPEGLERALSDLEALDGTRVTLQSLTHLKNSAHDAIAAFRTAHGDAKDRWFSRIAGAYERGIQQGIDQANNPELRTALTNARDTYKKELLPFERPGLKELAKDEFDSGRLSPEQVATRLFEGPKAIENIKMLKEVLGADNPAFRVLKRAWIDNQLFDESVLDRVTGQIDAEALSKKFQAFNKRPELEREMFGDKLPEILANLRYQKGFVSDKLDGVEVRTLFNLQNPSASDFQAIIRMQKNRDAAYANEIIKDVADGVIDGKPVNPTEFVGRLLNAKTKSSDVEFVLDAISKADPQTRSAIATATMYRLLDEATESTAELGAQALRGGALNISSEKLAKAIGRMEKDDRARIELLLGDEALPIIPGQVGPKRGEVLENLVMLLAPEEIKNKAMGTAGGLAAGQNILNLMHSPWRYATSYAQKLAASTIWTDKAFTKLISNRVYGPAESAALANTLIASEPFVRRTMEVLGDEAMAGTVINDLKESLDRWVQEQMETPQAREAQEMGRFARGERANVRIQPMR